MKILCIQNRFVSESARYTIEYLLNRCGFFFDWITDPSEAFPESAILLYAPGAEKLNYPVPVIFIPAVFNLPDLHNTPWQWDKTELQGYEIPLLKHDLRESSDANQNLNLKFDLVANIYFHLARIEEIKFRHPDDIDQSVEKSVLYEFGRLRIPVVDILIQWFAEQVDQFYITNKIFSLKKAQYPAAQKYSAALTHDVDFIRAYHPLKKIFKKIMLKMGVRSSNSISKIEQLDRDQWGFDRILDFYKTKNFRATFFFIPKYFENSHLRYRIASKKVKRLFTELKKDQHEIAFHPSRYAFENPNRYSSEKNKLERISQTKINGLRHHYLRCIYPDIWDKTHQLKLKYNSGMIYRKFSGFRAGTAFPFPAFNHKEQRESGILEFPVLFFENTLPGEGHILDESVDTINSLWHTIRDIQGMFTILWHSNNFYQPQTYADLWKHISELADDSEVFLTSLEQHAKWQKQRDKIILKNLCEDGQYISITLHVPNDLYAFALHVPAGFKFSTGKDLTMEHHDSILKITNPEQLEIIEIRAEPDE